MREPNNVAQILDDVKAAVRELPHGEKVARIQILTNARYTSDAAYMVPGKPRVQVTTSNPYTADNGAVVGVQDKEYLLAGEAGEARLQEVSSRIYPIS